MSLLIKGGITKLSELEIDADKGWQAKEIQNIKAIVAGMVEGDIAYRGINVLEKLAADYGVGYNFLHQKNTGGLLRPEWMDIQDIIIYLTGAVNRMAAPPTLAIPAPDLILTVAEDHSGGGHLAERPLIIPEPSITLVVAEDHVGGGFTCDKTLSIPAPGIADEAALIYENLRSGDDAQVSVYGVNWEAQTFTPGVNHSINRIGLKIRRHGGPGTLTVSIRATTGGLPSGGDLTSGTFDTGVLISEGVDYWIWISVTSHALTGGTKYAIVVRATAGDIDNYCQWRCDQSSPPYTGGARCYSGDSGGNWTEDTVRDFMFEEGVA